MLPWSVTEKVLRDVAEMRAFYQRMGISSAVAERALRARFNTSPEGQYVDGRGKTEKKRGRPPSKK